MLRPLLEAGTTAYWIIYAAASERVEKIARAAPMDGAERNDDTPTLGDMLNDLEKSDPRPPNVEGLRAACRSTEGAWLNKYTHGGIPQLRKLV
jgi:hypothetical protein